MQDEERIRDGRIHVVTQPTRERSAKRIDGERDVIVEEGDRGGCQMKSSSHPLDFYLRKRLITRLQWVAGNKLYKLWESGCLASYVQIQYRESTSSARSMQFTPPGAFAKEYREAMAAIGNVPQRRVAYYVCCEGQFLSTDPSFPSQRTARRHGMPLLIAALDALHNHFS